VPSNKQRRQAAQRRLQRQLERRAELARRRRRNLLIGVTAVAVLLVLGGVWFATGPGGDDSAETAAADASTSAPARTAQPATTNADGTAACDYAPDGTDEGPEAGPPPNATSTPTQGTSTLLMSTDQGDLTLTLDRAKAPCAAASFTHLAEQGFFDGSPCHRLVNQPGFGVLQCGDPTGSGMGGPGYRMAEEVTPETTYPRGTIAMAKSSAPNTTGSQFFLTFVDTGLPPEYTVVGTVDEAGLAVLDEVAAGGIAGVGPEGDGAPSTPVTIESMTVVS